MRDLLEEILHRNKEGRKKKRCDNRKHVVKTIDVNPNISLIKLNVN